MRKWIVAHKAELVEQWAKLHPKYGSYKMSELPRIKAIANGRAPYVLKITWKDGSRDVVDLTGFVHRASAFRVFLEQPAAFRNASLKDWGSAIEWPNGLDFGAATLKRIADEQRPMTGADLAKFERDFDLSGPETAALIGVTERTIRTYRDAADPLPTTVAARIRALRADHAIFAANYRPIERRPRGRPRKSAA